MADWLYGYVLVVGVLNGVVGTAQWRHWLELEVRGRLGWLALVGFNLTFVYGAAELLFRPPTDAGFRWYLACLSVTWLLGALVYDPIDRWHARRKETP